MHFGILMRAPLRGCDLDVPLTCPAYTFCFSTAPLLKRIQDIHSTVSVYLLYITDREITLILILGCPLLVCKKFKVQSDRSFMNIGGEVLS